MAVSTVWNTRKINESLEKLKIGMECEMSCFHERDPELKADNILFQYTQEEQQEFVKCSQDIVYFVEKYCRFMNDKGRTTVKMRDYQKDILNTVGEEQWIDEIEDYGPKHRNVIVMASRQVGKCFSIDAQSVIRKMKDETSTNYILSLLYYFNKEQLTLLEKIKVKLIIFYFKISNW